jgi:hypothetical protein
MMLKVTNLFGDLAASGVVTVTLDDNKVQGLTRMRY